MAEFLPPASSPELVAKVLKTDDIIMQLRLSLQGVEWVRNGVEKKLVRIADPRMNERGIQAVESVCRSFLNRNTSISNLKTHEEANKIIYELSNDITEHLILNMKDYNMKISDLDFIVDLVLDLIQFAAYRPVDEGERGLLQGITFENITHNVPMPEEKRGLLGLFSNPFKR